MFVLEQIQSFAYKVFYEECNRFERKLVNRKRLFARIENRWSPHDLFSFYFILSCVTITRSTSLDFFLNFQRFDRHVRRVKDEPRRDASSELRKQPLRKPTIGDPDRLLSVGALWNVLRYDRVSTTAATATAATTTATTASAPSTPATPRDPLAQGRVPVTAVRESITRHDIGEPFARSSSTPVTAHRHAWKLVAEHGRHENHSRQRPPRQTVRRIARPTPVDDKIEVVRRRENSLLTSEYK